MLFIGQINHHTKSWEIKGFHLKMKFVSSNKQVWPPQPLSLRLKKKKKKLKNTTQGQQSVIPSVMRCRPVSLINNGCNKYTYECTASLLLIMGQLNSFPQLPKLLYMLKWWGKTHNFNFSNIDWTVCQNDVTSSFKCIARISLVVKGPFSKWTKWTNLHDKTIKTGALQTKNTLPKVNDLANLH